MRNTTAFQLFTYRHDPQAAPKPLPSTLTNFRGLDKDFSALQTESCESIGRQAFESRLLPGVVTPSPGYPSFAAWGVTDLLADSTYFRGQQYRTFLAAVPQCAEETQPEELERFLLQLVRQERRDVYVGFPYQLEAVPVRFDDPLSSYTLFLDEAEQLQVQRAD